MSIFSSRRQDVDSVTTAAAAGCSVFDGPMVIHGDIETDGSVRLDGRLDGSVLRADVVVVGKDAAIHGDVNAREVVIGGTVHGNIRASARVEIQASAMVEGDIDAALVCIHEGGKVHGRLAIQALAENEHRLSHGKKPRLAAVAGEG